MHSDGSLKPHGRVIKNLNALLSDPGAAFVPGKLDFELSCDVGTVDDHNAFTEEIHHTLLQKRSGDFYLVLWNGAQSADVASKADRDVPERRCTVTVHTAIRGAEVYLPLESRDMRQAFTASSFEVNVPDHPLVVRLSR